MNKTLTISAIVLVAVVMGISSVVPVIPLAHAEHPCDGSAGDDPHACENENRPSCDDIKDEMEARGASPIAIRKFLENCVDRP